MPSCRLAWAKTSVAVDARSIACADFEPAVAVGAGADGVRLADRWRRRCELHVGVARRARRGRGPSDLRLDLVDRQLARLRLHGERKSGRRQLFVQHLFQLINTFHIVRGHRLIYPLLRDQQKELAATRKLVESQQHAITQLRDELDAIRVLGQKELINKIHSGCPSSIAARCTYRCVIAMDLCPRIFCSMRRVQRRSSPLSHALSGRLGQCRSASKASSW